MDPTQQLTSYEQALVCCVCAVQQIPAYSFRHHYAIVNINRWQDMGFSLHDHLLYLSKSMGHLSVESTRGYYAIVPALADTLMEKTADDMDWMLPDIEEDDL